MDKIIVPEKVSKLLNMLQKNGNDSYVVGGCLRDYIIGRRPEDWDIATDAPPETVRRLFEKTLESGLKHGTITVLIDGERFEVTTFRTDGIYEDNRRPKDVTFSTSILEDLSRRDFTMNAMAYSPKTGLIDPFNGRKDIANRIIRTVGNADTRFKEDALRMLRAIRFSSQLDFSIQQETLKSLCQNNNLICNISKERIREELSKILISENPMKFSLLSTTGLLDFFIPEFENCYHTFQNNPYHLYNVAEHSLHSVKKIRDVIFLRWTMLLHDIGKPLMKATGEDGLDHFIGHPEKSSQLSVIILKRLRFDKKTIEKIRRLILFHDVKIEANYSDVRRTVKLVGDDIFKNLIEVKIADRQAQNTEIVEKEIQDLKEIKNIYQSIKKENHCYNLKDLNINGNDLLVLGYPKGKVIGQTLGKLLEMVIEDQHINNKSSLKEIASKILLNGLK